MARDCPDRQKGTSWRNDGPRNAGRIGGGDAVDREYEVSPQPIYVSLGPDTNIEYSNLCKNSAAVPMAPRPASKLDPVLTTTAIVMLNLGSAVRLALPLRGGPGITITVMRVAAAAAVAAAVVQLHGVIATAPTTTTEVGTVITVAARITTLDRLRRVPHRGISRMLGSSRATPATLVTRATVQRLVWDRLLVFLEPPVWEAPLRVFPETLMR